MMKTVYTNPKNGEKIETEMQMIEAIQILEKKRKSNNFADSLLNALEKGYRLSESQEFWLYKLALEEQQGEQVYELLSDVEEFIRRGDTPIRFRYEDMGRLKLSPRKPDYLEVWIGGGINSFFCGKIKGDKFYPTRKCSIKIITTILLFSAAPLAFMQNYGREHGICCVCGRELENEESVRLGIGPICRGRFNAF